jgi:hypothetical protein
MEVLAGGKKCRFFQTSALLIGVLVGCGSAVSTLQHAYEVGVRMASFIFIVDFLHELVALLGLDSEQDGVDLGLHPIIALLRLRRADVQ